MRSMIRASLALLLALVPVLSPDLATGQQNYIQNVVGATPQLKAAGPSANISINIDPKGTGVVLCAGVPCLGGGGSFSTLTVGTAVQSIVIDGTVNPVTYTATGSAANIGFSFTAKGTGDITITSPAGDIAIDAPGSNITLGADNINITASLSTLRLQSGSSMSIDSGSDLNISVTDQMIVNTGVQTVSLPISFNQTWNDAAVTFTGLQWNITNTASAAASMIADFRVGGVSQWSVTRAGAVTQAGAHVLSANTASAFLFSNASKQVASTAAPTNGQLLIGSTGVVPVVGSIAGTTGQIGVTPGAGTIVLAISPTALGSATGKSILCIDNATNILYLSSNAATCAN